MPPLPTPPPAIAREPIPRRRFATGPLSIFETDKLPLDDIEQQRFSMLWFGFVVAVQVVATLRAPSRAAAAGSVALFLVAAVANALLLRAGARAKGDRFEAIRCATNAAFSFATILATGGMRSVMWMASFPAVINPTLVSARSSLLLALLTVACQWAAWLAAGTGVDWFEGVARSALLLSAAIFFRMMFDVQLAHRRRAAEAARAAERDRASKHEAEARFSLAEQSATHSRMASLGLLAASVAHEINNPINTIINASQIILDGDARQAGGEERFQKLIISEGERVARVVGNLLQFARGGGEEYGPTPLRRVIDKTLMLLQYQLDKDGIRVEIDLPRDLPSVRARPEELQQVFLNLFTNARYALLEQRRHRPDLRAAIRIGAAAEGAIEGTRVLCTVEDNGTGISADHLERIFDPFFTTKPKEEGTGLGLSVSSRIMREHRGRIEARSTPGSGTTFTLTLPAIAASGLENSTGTRWTAAVP